MQNAIAFSALGIESLVKDELKKLGIPPLGTEKGKVRFEATWDNIIRANMGLRTAERVGWELFHGPCEDFDQLFEALRSIDWENHFHSTDNILLDHIKLRGSRLTSVPSFQSVAQKAVFQRLSEKWNLQTLPLSGASRSLRLYLENNVLSVVLDTSGDPLHKRGYRKASGEAPLKETIAAALVLFSGWRRKFHLYDPFCGSGTILIEGGLFGRNQIPGVSRSFGFIGHPGCPMDRYKELRDEARKAVIVEPRMILSGSDIDQGLLNIAQANTDKARLEDYITYSAKDMAHASAPDGEPGFLICNPPYGERLETVEEARSMALKMRGLRERFEGWNMGFLTPLKDFPQLFGAQPFKVRTIQNGTMSVFYYQFMAP